MSANPPLAPAITPPRFKLMERGGVRIAILLDDNLT